MQLTPAQQQLAERHVPWAWRLARLKARQWPALLDDFTSAALYGLVRAAARFDPSRGIDFKTYAASRIHGEIIEVQRAAYPAGFRRRRSEAPQVIRGAVEHGGQELPLEELARAAELPVGWELESLDEVEARLRLLPPKEREVLRLYLTRCDTATLRQAAAELGFTKSYASQQLIRGLARLRQSISRARGVATVSTS